MSPGGRRPGDSGTREAILSAARASFARAGYDATSIRGIAREAGVDPALVHHFFGSKEGVFTAALALPLEPAEVVPALLAEGVEGLGERLVGLFLSLWDSATTREPLLGLLRSAVSHERATAMLREFLTAAVVGRVAAALDVPDAALRANLVGSQMAGLAMVRYVIALEPIASADHATVVAAVGPTIQRYLVGDLSGEAHRRDRIGDAIVEGYRRKPQTDDEVDRATRAAIASIEEEPS